MALRHRPPGGGERCSGGRGLRSPAGGAGVAARPARAGAALPRRPREGAPPPGSRGQGAGGPGRAGPCALPPSGRPGRRRSVGRAGMSAEVRPLRRSSALPGGTGGRECVVPGRRGIPPRPVRPLARGAATWVLRSGRGRRPGTGGRPCDPAGLVPLRRRRPCSLPRGQEFAPKATGHPRRLWGMVTAAGPTPPAPCAGASAV